LRYRYALRHVAVTTVDINQAAYPLADRVFSESLAAKRHKKHKKESKNRKLNFAASPKYALNAPLPFFLFFVSFAPFCG
jgi:hypothetical protein